MQTSTILVIDCGSSSMRGLLLDAQGKLVDSHRIKYAMRVEGESATQPPSDFANALESICAKIATQNKESTIAALALTSQRSSVLPVDDNGVPLDDVMMWYDKRARSICDEVNALHGEVLYKTCGILALPVLSAPKIHWYKENKPEMYNKAHKFIGIHDYLLHQMTGSLVTDTTLASRSHLMDVTNNRWSDVALDLYGLDKAKLCEIVPVGSVVGTIQTSFALKTGLDANTKVITAGGDQQCSALGTGLLHAGDTAITAGSGGYVVELSDAVVFDAQQRVGISVAAVPGKWQREVSCIATGTVYDWIQRAIGDTNSTIKDLDDMLLTTLPGANGVVMLSELAGRNCECAGLAEKGILLGIGLHTTKADIARATFEGIIAELADCCSLLWETGDMRSAVYTTGGLAKFSLFNEVLADMLGTTVQQCQERETTSIGAWALAAVAIGLQPSLAKAIHTAQQSFTQFTCDRSKQELYLKQNKVRQYVRNNISFKEIQNLLL